jgi:hypothetical protein
MDVALYLLKLLMSKKEVDLEDFDEYFDWFMQLYLYKLKEFIVSTNS